MRRIATVLAIGVAALGGCSNPAPEAQEEIPGGPLSGKVIVLDPGHGGTAETDPFRVGPAGEREEWVNLRVGLALRDLLEARGATVLMTRTEDVEIGLRERAVLAVDNGADLFLSIHHNATADPGVNFPIIYYHGNASENQASVALGRTVARRLADALHDGDTPISLVSDHVIFPNSGTAVLRHSYGIPGVIGEASFFTDPGEERRLIDPAHNRREAEAYLVAIEEFLALDPLPIEEKHSTGRIEPFEAFQEAERMRPEARRWRENFDQGSALLTEGQFQEALELLDLCARAFPDSPVARACHQNRARALFLLGHDAESQMAQRRVEEFYVPVE